MDYSNNAYTLNNNALGQFSCCSNTFPLSGTLIYIIIIIIITY